MKQLFVLFAFIFSVQFSFAQDSIGIYPTNWWVGMKNPRLQIMLHGAGIASSNVIVDYPGVTINKVSKVENKNYLFVDLTISKLAKPGIDFNSFIKWKKHFFRT